MDNLKELGKLLEKTRVEKGLSIDAVSKKTHIHPRILKGIEDGAPDPKLTPIYIKGFVKKYAESLGLNADELMKKYAVTMSLRRPEQKLYIPPKDEVDINIMKYLPVLIAVLGVIVIAFFLVMGTVQLAGFIMKSLPKRTHKAAAVRAPSKKAAARTANAASPTAAEIKKSLEENQIITLTADTGDDVWVHVLSDGNLAFTGIIKKGSTETWTAAESIQMKVGLLSVMKFTVNGLYLGKIGDGVKTLYFKKSGIKVGDKDILASN